jgi:hypothetical protein
MWDKFLPTSKNRERDGALDFDGGCFIQMYVNPQMVTNFILEQGVLIWKVLNLPVFFHKGSPHLETRT